VLHRAVIGPNPPNPGIDPTWYRDQAA
jgi:hypothetical protein